MDQQIPMLKAPRFWLEYIEPKILRPEKSSCWLWQGGCDAEGEPVTTIFNPKTGGRTTRRIKVVIAEHYWDMDPHYRTYRTCSNLNCLRPEHFYVNDGPQDEELRAILERKRKRIIQYERHQL